MMNDAKNCDNSKYDFDVSVSWSQTFVVFITAFWIAALQSNILASFLPSSFYFGLFPQLSYTELPWAAFIVSWTGWPIIQTSMILSWTSKFKSVDWSKLFCRPKTNFGVTCGLIFLCFLSAVSLIYVVSFFVDSNSQQEVRIIAYLLTSPMAWMMLLGMIVIGPVFEEMMFRGMLLSSLARSRIGIFGAAVVTSAIWSFIHHYDWLIAVSIFAIGLMLSMLRLKTASLWPCIIVHGLNNTASAVGLIWNGN